MPLPDAAPERDPNLSPDDLGTVREAQFLAAALSVHAARAALALRGFPGTCSNCGSACAPAAVYCDADCRSDHEARERVRKRGGGGLPLVA